jgi:serine O-acetyltransferase
MDFRPDPTNYPGIGRDAGRSLPGTVCMMRRERRIASLRELWALLREDRKSNGSVFNPGFQALAVHRFGVWKHALEPKLVRLPFTVVYRVLNRFVRNVYGIELHINTRIGRRLLIGHQHGIIIHPNATIGDDCLIIQGVTIGQDRDTRGSFPPPAPKLGNRVRVGAGAVIAGDITIGDDVRIGPNAVVMQNVPAGAIVSAPPSRIMASPPRRVPRAEADRLRDTGT